MQNRILGSLQDGWRPALVAGAACGICATLIALADQLIWRPLPVDVTPVYFLGGLTEAPGWNAEAYWRQASHASHIARYSSGFVNAGIGDSARRMLVAGVSPQFFDVFQLRAHRGRWPAGPGEAALSFEFWDAQLARSEEILEREIVLNGETFQVTGIAPAGFRFPGVAQAWVAAPLRTVTAGTETGLAPPYGWVGRLREGSTAADLRGELRGLLRRQIDELNRRPNANFGRQGDVAVTPLRERLGAGTKSSIAAVATAAALLTVIALANVFALLRVTVALRRRELAVRLALGASAARVMLAALRNGIAAAALAAALAAVAAHVLSGQLAEVLRAMFGGLPVFAPRIFPPPLAAAAAFLLTMGTAAAACARVARQDLLDSLRDSGAGWLPWLGARAFSALFVAQLAVSLVLGAAGLATMSSYAGVQAEPLGFSPGHAARLELSFLPPAYDAAKAAIARDRILEAVRSAPGVSEASLTSDLPLAFGAQTRMLSVIPGGGKMNQMVATTTVSDGYFRTMGMVLRGRDFATADRAVAILSESAARRLFPGGEARGRTIRVEGEDFGREVTGVVGDAADRYRDDNPFAGRLYLPIAAPFRSTPGTVNLIVRCRESCAAVLPGVRASVLTEAPGIPADGWQTLDEVVRQAQSPWRAVAWTLGVFALAGVMSAAAGAFGLSSLHAVAKAHEIGVRLACGGTPQAIIRRLLGRLAWLAASGCAAGLLLCHLLGQAAARLTRNADLLDWRVLGWSTAVYVAVVMAAAAVPAVRAVLKDPLQVLRGPQ